MKLTIKQINTEIVPQLGRMEQENPGAQAAIKKFFEQYGRIYEDDRFKQLTGQIEANKQLLKELELKQQYRENIAKLEGAISELDYDFQPVQVTGQVPAALAGIFVSAPEEKKAEIPAHPETPHGPEHTNDPGIPKEARRLKRKMEAAK